KAVVALRRINYILSTTEETEQPIPSVSRLHGEIEFEHVSIRFGAETAAIENVSVRVAAGETIGVVGAPGSGKSTMLRALLRVHELASGRILVDGLDITTINRKWLRAISLLALGTREPFSG
ncbi:MAG: ATP-binding cassette domain-containing protein, partial [Pseudomonadales bacterium]|nr:ATP-binding cassette domain-containing protein [Pseudomonadales bacterium]